ncbi:MAG: dockerin type I domain-containing protein, partial [Planctomycetota bacterium]
QRHHQVTSANNIVLMSNALGWQNPFDEMDVNYDGVVTPLDALLVINLLNAGLTSQLSVSEDRFANADYVDTSGDGNLTPLDALLVINALA